MALFSSLSEIDLGALSKEITDNAVDIFVYDTRKDSDGGAWRKRTKKTSWYNETLNTTIRGSRREFPAVAVIVLTATTAIIYDGDDPDMPMWMIIPSTTVDWASNPGDAAAVYALNGIICIATIGAGTIILEFVSDTRLIAYSNPTYNFENKFITGRNSKVYRSGGGYPILNPRCNDVAMIVLPNAPIDPATELPRPTILIGQNGGLSIINDDDAQTVLSRQNTWTNGGGVWEVAFDEKHGGYWYSTAYYAETNGTYPNHGLVVGYEPDITANSTLSQANENYQDRIHLSIGKSPTGNGLWNAQHIPDVWLIGAWSNANGGKITFNNQGEHFGCQYGLTLFDGAYETIGSTTRSSLGCYINSDYNTGWMHGDIKGAFLSDTDATNITRGNLSADSVPLTRTFGQRLLLSTSLIIGALYEITYTITSSDYTGDLYFEPTNAPFSYSIVPKTVGTHTVFRRALNTNTSLLSLGGSAGQTGSITFSSIVVTRAEEDRSVNANGLQVFGTITKSPVATGADLVAYSGFSGQPYDGGNGLTQPYNSSLNFGTTGEFHYSVWFKRSSTGAAVILHRSSETSTTDFNSSGQIHQMEFSTTRFQFGVYLQGFVDGTGNFQIPQEKFSLNSWNHVMWLRRSNGFVELYINGTYVQPSEYTIYPPGGITNIDATNTSARLHIGYRPGNTRPFNGSLALFKVGASAPSAEQIKKIYEDEKDLFQVNAKCTLYGSSNAVTALAYDDKTNLLHVGTSSGRSDFRKLRRINNTTTGITTSISASNGIIAEQ